MVDEQRAFGPFVLPAAFLWPVPASSRVNPLPQTSRYFESCAVPVGAGLPAKRPAQAINKACDRRAP
ncbi:hypothetical protein CR512_21020 [Pseudomonas putida]|nr:hypothetical protein CR512_21020 [Pseudomonas putida]